MTSRRSLRGLGIAASIGLVVLLAIFLVRNTLLAWPGQRLVRDDHPQKNAPAMFILLGDWGGTRAHTAAELFAQGYAGKIHLAEEEPSDFVAGGFMPSLATTHQRYLIGQQVPLDAIVRLECVVTSTREEGLCIRAYLRKTTPKPSRIVVVTSWFHTRRAGWLLDTIMEGEGVNVEMAPSYGRDSHPSTWWQHEESFICVIEEYIKTVFWWFRGIDANPQT